MVNIKWVAVGLLGVISAIVIFHFMPQQGASDFPVSKEIFQESLAAASNVFVVMDLRGAQQSSYQAIMQCGVDIAGSEALAPKNITPIVYDDKGVCLIGNATDLSISYCEELSRSGVSFVIKEGNQTTDFYIQKAVISIKEYNQSCKVSLVRSNKSISSPPLSNSS